ncbi:Sugar or nucleoside kinase, ribokinase family [Ferrimonas sediminum]|uniref:Sugar or nucleoside kinase, ribokinase family n=1 Tax=Ferrimonas sediminum TaxID=718193 RepID=A0A1G8JUH0_9GAMM|nr:PfkB family carbohydrate kinase [Ferrimonas sediminum]SDI34250.1 Sugar or nucleoside kinase, ribokinase family [Ferrimonas sediminum]
MARILTIANLNCDHILRLSRPLTTGARIHYEDLGKRIGGGAANTGTALAWAGHQVALLSQVGSDDLGDWLLQQAEQLGLDCQQVHRHPGPTQALQLLMEPDGERTILRPNRPRLLLPASLSHQPMDALYVNLTAEGLPQLMQSALQQATVIAQLPKDLSRRPCHYLITSVDDLGQHHIEDPWQFGQQIAGGSLQAFIVTQGENGAIAYTQDGSFSVAAMATEVVDTTGAGDAYAAGLIDGLLRQQDLQHAMEQGARWASFALQSASSIPSEKLRSFLKHTQG